MDHDMVQLPGLLPEFSADGYTIPPGVTNNRIWKAIVDGQLPAVKVGSRYWVRREDKPTYAAHFGLRHAPVEPARQASAASVPVAA